MAMMEIVHYGDPILRKKCKPFQDFSRLETILEDMFDSMYEADGIGLAANQIGFDINLFIIDVTHTDEAEVPHIFINGDIVKKVGEDGIFQEGCLSMPGIALDVLRPENVILKYQTPDQKWHEDEFGGLLSRAIQHEMDHLNGVFIIDRVGEVERIQYQNELKELEKKSKIRQKNRSIQKGFVL
ncbi:MAG: peptide deformylase [Candidatus Marinimicrobia bacterium]|nr:peptide deformylase [Candidatus Neomarinimicrobiota bacterium]